MRSLENCIGSQWLVRVGVVRTKLLYKHLEVNHFDGGVKVLVVDNEIDTCNLLVCLLEECGAIADAANSTEAALAILEESQPDILITDLAMSDSDGYSFIHRLRNLEAQQGGNIPAIALTALSPEAPSPPSIPLGFQEHLLKPIEADKLITTVINLLEKAAVGKV